MKKRKLLALLILIAAILGTLYVLPSLIVPKRWHDIAPGMSRCQTHAILGLPNASIGDKNIDGWHEPFTYGANVVVIHYTNDYTKVDSIEIKQHFGTEYQTWMNQYQRIIAQPASLHQMACYR